MNIDDVKNIAVIGAGNMGHQISMLCAIHGYKTVCTDINQEILKKAERFADTYLAGRVKKEVDGFLLNRIFGAITREALWLLEMGVASMEDIDKAQVYGAGHPMGTFRLMDLTGIDLTYTMGMEAFRETGDTRNLPSPRVVEKYVKDEYGQKTGKGWYDYS